MVKVFVAGLVLSAIDLHRILSEPSVKLAVICIDYKYPEQFLVLFNIVKKNGNAFDKAPLIT